ncbi:MAG: NAD-dependent epimerase/dehydratase family protein [Nitrospinaceae bacterium]|nr:NAD-dependent epimerase/dehydratase family protein [Nitrospinaceae bacterium]
MNILLTGASSGLGVALIRRLSNSPDLEIKAMVHRSLVNIDGCEARQGDLDKPELLARAVDGIDTVIHMAALTSSAQESEYFRTNVAGTQNLVDACVLAGVKRIIHISSRAASLDGGGYSRSKLEAEECVKKSGLQWLILRPSEVYGQGTGDTINRLIHWVRRYPLVPVIGTGQARLSPVYIDDLVSVIERLIFDGVLTSETILLAGPEDLTFDELVDRIAGYFGVRRFKLHLPAGLVKFAATVLSGMGMKILVPDQIPRLLCSKDQDISKTSALISYSPRKLEEGMAEYWRD